MTLSNTTTNRYGTIASEIYDIDKPVGKLPDTALYLSRLADLKGPILEPGCGSGRTMLPFLQAGHTVTGFDFSPDMLQRCRALCAGNGFDPDLSVQEFETFRYDQPFAAIIMPAGSFTLIRDARAAQRVLERFHAHLTTGGRLILDIMPVGALAAARDDRRQWTATNGDLLTLEGIRPPPDWRAQCSRYTIRYERWRNNVLVESQLEPMAQRYWGIEEFRMALELAGFGNIRMTFDYRGNGDVPTNPRTVTYDAVKT